MKLSDEKQVAITRVIEHSQEPGADQPEGVPEKDNEAGWQKTRRLWRNDPAYRISVLALAVSVLQLLFTPIIMDLYLRPRVTIESATMVTSDLRAGLVVSNRGRSTASEVEVGVVTFNGDTIHLTLNLGATITNDGGLFFRTYRVVVPYLAPGDVFVILVRKPQNPNKEILDRIRRWNNLLSERKMSPMIPSIAYARSRAGEAQIKAPRFSLGLVRK